ncbi:MAG: DUF4846 domain-containing protein [Limisphaerales bacterium]
MRSGLLVVALFSVVSSLMGQGIHPWKPESTNTIVSSIAPPFGYQRVAVPNLSFGNWLRHLPLKPRGTRVKLYHGGLKSNQGAHHAVVDIDTGTRDLQQCADAVIRLRAEYLYFARQYTNIQFNFTSGDSNRFDWWYSGYRPVVAGNKVTWKKQASFDFSYPNFRKYLTKTFAYAGTLSLARDLPSRATIVDLMIGDVFVKGGSPGHAVIVLDVAMNQEKKKVFLLGQSYMPAQDFHVLKNPNHPGQSPWYSIQIRGDLVTPEWSFDWSQLKYFPE